MTRWKLTIEYHGGDFSGWQRQSHCLSVQQVIEDAIFKFSGETVTLHVCGRTDTGVHARANVAHVDIAKETTADIVRDAVNFHAKPHRVVLVDVEAVPDTFHARFDAQSRSYVYRIINRRAPLALLPDQAWHVYRPLDVAAMQRAADTLIGHHDFSTFRAHNCQANSPMRTMDVLNITHEGEEVRLYTRARSFLYHQVRNMVGTLVMVGNGQWTYEQFVDAFQACDRRAGGPTAPPQGLIFWKVIYPQNNPQMK